MNKTPEQLKKEVLTLLDRVTDLNEQITRIINVFPTYYEEMLRILNIVAAANKCSNEIQIHLENWRERGVAADDLNSDDLAFIDRIMRTQEWAQKNHEIATSAIQRLSDLEDVTLQFYDNQHPDVVID